MGGVNSKKLKAIHGFTKKSIVGSREELTECEYNLESLSLNITFKSRKADSFSEFLDGLEISRLLQQRAYLPQACPYWSSGSLSFQPP